MIYGYCRATTEKQIEDGYLNAQEELISNRYVFATIKHEKGCDINNLTVFNELMEILEKDDTLVVTKMDRFAKSISSAIEIIKKLREKGIKIHILNLGIIDGSMLGNVVFNCLEAFEDFEKSLIVERTQRGKKIAKKNKNFKEGRPKKYTDEQLIAAVKMLQTKSYREVELETGISKSTLIRSKKKFEDSVY